MKTFVFFFLLTSSAAAQMGTVYSGFYPEGEGAEFVDPSDPTSVLSLDYPDGGSSFTGPLVADDDGNWFAVYATSFGVDQSPNAVLRISKLGHDVTTVIFQNDVPMGVPNQEFSIMAATVGPYGDVYAVGRGQIVAEHVYGDEINADAFVMVFDGQTGDLKKSIRFGGENETDPADIAVGCDRTIHVVGSTTSQVDFPTPNGFIQALSLTGGSSWAFVASFGYDVETDVVSQLFGTLWGGSEGYASRFSAVDVSETGAVLAGGSIDDDGLRLVNSPEGKNTEPGFLDRTRGLVFGLKIPAAPIPQSGGVFLSGYAGGTWEQLGIGHNHLSGVTDIAFRPEDKDCVDIPQGQTGFGDWGLCDDPILVGCFPIYDGFDVPGEIYIAGHGPINASTAFFENPTSNSLPQSRVFVSRLSANQGYRATFAIGPGGSPRIALADDESVWLSATVHTLGVPMVEPLPSQVVPDVADYPGYDSRPMLFHLDPTGTTLKQSTTLGDKIGSVHWSPKAAGVQLLDGGATVLYQGFASCSSSQSCLGFFPVVQSNEGIIGHQNGVSRRTIAAYIPETCAIENALGSADVLGKPIRSRAQEDASESAKNRFRQAREKFFRSSRAGRRFVTFYHEYNSTAWELMANSPIFMSKAVRLLWEIDSIVEGWLSDERPRALERETVQDLQAFLAEFANIARRASEDRFARALEREAACIPWTELADAYPEDAWLKIVRQCER